MHTTMRKLKHCFWSAVAFCITVSLHGNPKEFIYAYCIARGIEWHMYENNGSESIKQIFEKLNRCRAVTTEDVQPLFPEGYRIESIKLKSVNKKGFSFLMHEERSGNIPEESTVQAENPDCVLVRFRFLNVPFTFTLCLKHDGKCNTVAVHAEHEISKETVEKTSGAWVRSEAFFCLTSKVWNETRLMKYAHENYDVFSKHLYTLLNTHIQENRKVNPLAIQMRDAFEQNGYALDKTVEFVPCFEINAENTYAFIQRWVRQQYEKGRSVPAITADLQPVYNLLLKGLCARVGEFSQSTIVTVKNNGRSYYCVQYLKSQEGGKFRVKDLSHEETFGE